MKITTILFAATLVILLLNNCEKDENSNANISYIAQRMGTDGDEKYFWKGNKLDSLKEYNNYHYGDFDSTTTVFHYENSFIKRIEVFGNPDDYKGFFKDIILPYYQITEKLKRNKEIEKLEYMDFFYNDKKISKIDYYYQNNYGEMELSMSRIIQYKYNKLDTVKYTFPETGEKIMGFVVYEYNGNNVINIKSYFLNDLEDSIFRFSHEVIVDYDQAHNMYAGLQYINTFMPAYNNPIQRIWKDYHYDSDGELQYTYTQTDSYTYEYNEKNYPVMEYESVDNNGYISMDTAAISYR